MDCKRVFTVIQIERLLLPVKWEKKKWTILDIISKQTIFLSKNWLVVKVPKP